ncbi:dynein regulatory complex protein 9 isoform X1 [Athalia rosae]|uniref:dynein regulatory complex protein 9 isoform X1 n=1 Tax=Athalia rosae TaxID=37344 RepID=UPI002033D804|nr:dynein regulatory complex protein 9 isoform X1 [Athalia rosae]XP_048512935.1 dynein regulatory complex protein 9 isoform X1 [Athalia rosae]XP_048512936.1 dynein regulatory complex protein 9 isoform X1 [Athalia rosae]XP_048512937.1 dynein regulatory complex protein 9 isoform X1 [Athalia rosae]
MEITAERKEGGERRRNPNTVVRGREDEKVVLLSTSEREIVIFALQECLERITTVLEKANVKKTDVNLSFVPTDARYLSSDLIKSRLLYTSEERAVKDMKIEAGFQKLRNDSAYVVSILEQTVRELRVNGSFPTLRSIPNKLRDIQKKEMSVLAKARKNIETLKSLKELVAQERYANELENKEYREKLATATREMEIQNAKGRASITYVSAWEKARCEQNVARCNIAEEELRRTLAKLKVEEKNEKRINGNIEAFLCHNIAENEEKIIEWRKRYDREWTQYTNEIGRLQKQINIEKTALARLKEEQRVKQNFIDEYLAEKKAERKKMEHEEHVRNSTIKIQAWWRGVMVRRKLGPYRPEEKKKKRPTKSKK